MSWWSHTQYGHVEITKYFWPKPHFTTTLVVTSHESNTFSCLRPLRLADDHAGEDPCEHGSTNTCLWCKNRTSIAFTGSCISKLQVDTSKYFFSNVYWLLLRKVNHYMEHHCVYIWSLPHYVKMQYLHVRFYANYFLLPWNIPEEISRRSLLSHN